MHCRLLHQVPYCEESYGLSVDDLIRAAKAVFAEFELPRKIVSDTGPNFISDQCKQFCM